MKPRTPMYQKVFQKDDWVIWEYTPKKLFFVRHILAKQPSRYYYQHIETPNFFNSDDKGTVTEEFKLG